MSVRCFTLLLSLYLSFQKASSLSVTTTLQYNLKDPDSVTVVCQYDRQKNWTIDVQLLYNNEKLCESTQVSISQQDNQTMFTLKNLTSAKKSQSYHCLVYRVSPMPIIKRTGSAFRLFPESHILPCIPSTNTDSDNVCPPPETVSNPNTLVWVWALIGLMFLLCLYSLIITTLYINLKIARSEDMNDTLTYVPMQKQVRRKDAEKNAEYMDMRKGHPRTGPTRDLNHNSHRFPAVF